MPKSLQAEPQLLTALLSTVSVKQAPGAPFSNGSTDGGIFGCGLSACVCEYSRGNCALTEDWNAAESTIVQSRLGTMLSTMSPTKPSQQERVDYCRDAFAFSSFQATLEMIELLKKLQLPRDRELLNALSVAITISYLAPFKSTDRQTGGIVNFKMSRDLVPPQYRKAHDKIVVERDKVIAHRDVNHQTPEGDFPNEMGLIMTREGDNISCQALVTRPVIFQDLARDIQRIVEHFLPLLHSRIFAFIKAHVPGDLPAGRYIVSMDRDPEEFLSRQPD